MSVNPDSPVAMYEQLANLLREKIDAGEITGKLPSVTRLQQEYGIGSQVTVLRAIELLVAEGVVYTVTRRGTYVSDSYKR